MSQVKLDAISMQGLIKLSRQQGTQLNALDACEQWIVGADKEIASLRQRVAELEETNAAIKRVTSEWRKDAERWKSLIALTCNGHVDLWVRSPMEKLMIRVQEDTLFRVELFDQLFKENVQADAAMTDPDDDFTRGEHDL